MEKSSSNILPNIFYVSLKNGKQNFKIVVINNNNVFSQWSAFLIKCLHRFTRRLKAMLWWSWFHNMSHYYLHVPSQCDHRLWSGRIGGEFGALSLSLILIALAVAAADTVVMVEQFSLHCLVLKLTEFLINSQRCMVYISLLCFLCICILMHSYLYERERDWREKNARFRAVPWC